MMIQNEWEIWWARVKYEDTPEVKTRPVLIISKNIAILISLKITSHKPRKQYVGEYQIREWQFAGLKKPSTIRVSKVLELCPEDFVGKVGMLHPIDIFGVQTLWRELHR